MKLFIGALTAAAVLSAAAGVVAPAAHSDCYSPAYHWREVCTGAGGAPGPGQTPFTGYPNTPAPIHCTYTATGQVADCSSGGPADMPQSPITGAQTVPNPCPDGIDPTHTSPNWQDPSWPFNQCGLPKR